MNGIGFIPEGREEIFSWSNTSSSSSVVPTFVPSTPSKGSANGKTEEGAVCGIREGIFTELGRSSVEYSTIGKSGGLTVELSSCWGVSGFKVMSSLMSLVRSTGTGRGVNLSLGGAWNDKYEALSGLGASNRFKSTA